MVIFHENSRKNRTQIRKYESDIRRQWTSVQFGSSLQQVFTPFSIVLEMLEKVRTLNNRDVCVIANSEIYLFIKGLKEKGFKNFQYKSLTFVTDIKSLEGKDNVKVVDFTNLNKVNLSMKFDVVIGNPPYQTVSSNRKLNSDKNLWLTFVNHFIEYLNTKGTITFITPPPIGKQQRNKKADYSVFLDKQIDFVKILTAKESQEYFPGVGSKFSVYTIVNEDKHTPTKIQIGNETTTVFLDKIKAVPSAENIAVFDVFKAINRSERFDVKSNFECHSQQIKKGKLSLIKSNECPYVLINTNSDRKYNSYKQSIFEIPKVLIFTFSALKDSKYSIQENFTENQRYIEVENEKDGEQLLKVLNSKFYTFFSKNFRSGRALNWKHIPFYPWRNFTSDEDIYKFFNLKPETVSYIEANY